MSKIDDLISKIEDEELRNRIYDEVRKLKKQKKFGLVYEEHLPEATILYDVPVKRGASVVRRDGDINEVYCVTNITGDTAHCMRMDATKEVSAFSLNDIVVVAQFGKPIYPFVKKMDSVCNAPDSDLWHMLIEADNYHALQLLVYLYGGNVDCIYIDPPYNTGAKDWKYNNDYVDSNDAYRHSKWLSFMEHRLNLAKQLLNPKDSVLIVTIDDKEYLHLGMLLEKLFAGSKITMISSVINPAGKAKKGGIDFSRTDEYIYFVQIGNSVVLPETREIIETPIAWETFRRHSLANGRGKHGVGACGPNQFYPIYIDNKTHKIVEIGHPLPENVSRHTVKQIEGCTAVFPVRDNGIEMNWASVREEALKRLSKGYLKVGSYTPNKPQQFIIKYLTSGTIKAIENGEVIVQGYDKDGGIIGYFPDGKPKVPTTNWNKPTHNATSFGTDVLKKLFTDNRFDYPKSIYAVFDCIKAFIATKKDAIVLDFFAGSGTTLHAVNLLNAEDGGNRKCIMVTNNEVSNEEAKKLSEQGYRQGNEEWEKLGIARHVNWPRTVCSIKGEDINGKPLKGSYLVADIPMADGFKSNAIFFKLGFLDKTEVAFGRNLKELIPLLWMKANAIGECPNMEFETTPDMIILPENKMAILVEEDAYPKFKDEVSNVDVETVFIITDSEDGYREMISRLNVKQTYQLYRDYLDNFTINK